MKLFKLLLIIGLCICSSSSALFACRYNVRETGFVYLGAEPYYLYALIKIPTESQGIRRIKAVADRILSDSSIEFEPINVDEADSHPALEVLDKENITSFPAWVLVAPDGRSTRLPGRLIDPISERNLQLMLRDILHSPIRDKIVRETAKYYGVVLLIESNDNERNQSALQSIQSAMESIKSEMKNMPKSITNPPVVVTLEAGDIEKESLLLWSLNLQEHDPQETYAAVFYGKGRWIGPLLKGDRITKHNVYNVLSVVGMDCECGLNRRIIRGTILPIQWSKEIQAMTVDYLNFDPENPMIKMEVSRILRLGYYPSVDDSNRYLGDGQNVSPFDSASLALPLSLDDSMQAGSLAKTSKSPYWNSIIIFTGISIVIIAIGVFIMLRGARNN